MTAMPRDRDGHVRSERGSALVVALMATTVLSIAGSALLLVAQLETAIAANALRDVRTFYAADAALRRARADLESLADWTPVLQGMATSSFAEGTPVPGQLGRVFVDVTAAGAALQAASLPLGANNPQWTLFLWGPLERLLTGVEWPGYVAVWLADDAAETDQDPRGDGGSPDARGRGIVRLHAVAFDGAGARRTLEATAARTATGRVQLLVGQAVR
jgi:hypothetical protein